MNHTSLNPPSGSQCGLNLQRLTRISFCSLVFQLSASQFERNANQIHCNLDNSSESSQFNFFFIVKVFVVSPRINHGNRRLPVLEWTHHQLLHINAVSSFTETPNILNQEWRFALRTGRQGSVSSGAPAASK